MIGAITAGLYGTGVPPVTNSYESIATVTVGSGGASDITFSSIASTYKHLQVRWIGRTNRASTQDDIAFQLNGDTGSNYSRHSLDGNGASASAYGQGSVSQPPCGLMPAASATSGIFGLGIMDVLDYANTNKYKTVRILGGHDRNGAGQISLNSSVWVNSNATTSIRIFSTNSASFVEFSQFALYGIKG